MKQLSRPLVAVLLALAVCLASTESEARSEFRLTLGADYQINQGAFFDLTGAVDFIFLGPLSIGARFGAMLATSPTSFGIPIDLDLRISPRGAPIYLEALVGPWLRFSGEFVRAHGAFGFGYQNRSFTFGLEVGWLTPSPHVGLRIGWRL
ncbi:hypothetical protein CYFUS_000334 [Cystobacter fuscus]|uniref:Outer membrane protein beta-barrel domain-containing protein n=1 Tax=Cystobacter fuscus TaxID=43 RepID=A0A250IUK0_9BACT|nr:hypothetical protein [Cystobacter fuscus]ATB34922.1 hypothetical protein CYFUS_000334 [Cystobacter fuscus]